MASVRACVCLRVRMSVRVHRERQLVLSARRLSRLAVGDSNCRKQLGGKIQRSGGNLLSSLPPGPDVVVDVDTRTFGQFKMYVIVCFSNVRCGPVKKPALPTLTSKSFTFSVWDLSLISAWKSVHQMQETVIMC